MTQLWLIITTVGVVAACAFAAGYLVSLTSRSWPGGPPAQVGALPPTSTIEADVRRLAQRYHSMPPHTSYVKVAAVRAGLDRALAQYCEAVGTPHRLHELSEGPALDAERARIEDFVATPVAL